MIGMPFPQHLKLVTRQDAETRREAVLWISDGIFHVFVVVKAKLERVTTYLINSWVMGVASCVRLQVGCWYFFTPPPQKSTSSLNRFFWLMLCYLVCLSPFRIRKIYASAPASWIQKMRTAWRQPTDMKKPKGFWWQKFRDAAEISGNGTFQISIGGGEMHDGMFICIIYVWLRVCIYIYIWMIYDIWMYILYCPCSWQRVCRTVYPPISFFLTKPFFSGLAGEKRAGEEEGVGGVSWQSQRATGVAGGIWQVAKCFWMAGVSLEYHLQNMVPQVWPLDEWTIRFAKCMYIIYTVTQPPYPNELLEEGFKIFFV